MRQNKLTMGAKIAWSTGLLAAMLILMAAYGLYAVGAINGSFETTANQTARRAVLIGDLSQAVSDMAAAERGLLVFTYAKEPALQSDARQLFQISLSRVRSAVAEIQPSLITDEGKRTLEDVNSRLAQWLAAYGDMERLVDAGDPDGAVQLMRIRITSHYQAVSADCQRLAILMNQVLQGDKQTAHDQYATAQWLLILLLAGGAAAAAWALMAARLATRQLQRLAAEMLEGSRQVAAASGQVASASQ
jgi:CHASE3 domain sensor protein